jgi:hypothetical protein
MEKGSRNRRKPESEAISLYATLQEPEFRCFTLNSSVVFEVMCMSQPLNHAALCRTRLLQRAQWKAWWLCLHTCVSQPLNHAALCRTRLLQRAQWKAWWLCLHTCMSQPLNHAALCRTRLLQWARWTKAWRLCLSACPRFSCSALGLRQGSILLRCVCVCGWVCVCGCVRACVYVWRKHTSPIQCVENVVCFHRSQSYGHTPSQFLKNVTACFQLHFIWSYTPSQCAKNVFHCSFGHVHPHSA